MTGTNSLVTSSSSRNQDYFINGSYYFILGSYFDAFSGGDAQARSAINTAFTASNIGCSVNGNSYGAGAASLPFVINGTPGNQSAAVGGAGATVWISDTTHSDSVGAAQNWNARFTANSGGPDCHITLLQMIANAAAPIASYNSGGNQLTGYSSGLTYLQIFGDQPSGTEGQAATPLRASGTFSGLSANYLAPAGTVAFASRKNGGAGNQSITGGGSAAVVQDTTHSDSYASGDTSDTQANNSSGSPQASTVNGFSGATSKQDSGNTTGVAATAAAATTYYFALGGILGFIANNTSEAQMQQKLPYALTASNLRVQVVTNTAGTAALTSRVAAGAGNQTVAVTLAGTGVFEDTTHTDSFASGALVDMQLVPASASLGINFVGMSLNDGSFAGHTNTGQLPLLGLGD